MSELVKLLLYIYNYNVAIGTAHLSVIWSLRWGRDLEMNLLRVHIWTHTTQHQTERGRSCSSSSSSTLVYLNLWAYGTVHHRLQSQRALPPSKPVSSLIPSEGSSWLRVDFSLTHSLTHGSSGDSSSRKGLNKKYIFGERKSASFAYRIREHGETIHIFLLSFLLSCFSLIQSFSKLKRTLELARSILTDYVL